MKLLSEKLKEQTLQSHREIEKCKGMSLLMTKELSKSQYALILSCWLGYLNQAEQLIMNNEDVKRLLDNNDERTKANLIVSDLNHLKIDVNKLNMEVADVELINPAQFFGYAYVIEGSTLGAQFITKKLKTHDFIDENCISFYNGYVHKTGEMWKNFKTSLDFWGEKNMGKHEEVIEHARKTFTSIQNQMNKNFTQQNLNCIETQFS